MYKINNVSLTYKYIVLMIFAGMISYKISPTLIYTFTLIFLSMLFFFKIKLYQLKLSIILYILLIILVLVIGYFYQLINYSFNNFYYIQFFSSQVFLFYYLDYILILIRLNISTWRSFFL